MFTYCQHRGVSEDGKVICRKIGRGDQEVSLAICEACPAAACNCGHLRFSLEKQNEMPIIIRYGNGRTEILESGPAAVRFIKSACAVQLRPIDTQKDCVGCPLRSDGFVREAMPISQADFTPVRAKIIPFPHIAVTRG